MPPQSTLVGLREQLEADYLFLESVRAQIARLEALLEPERQREREHRKRMAKYPPVEVDNA